MLVLWTHRARRRLVALVAGELMLGSLVFYVTINEAFYGSPTPEDLTFARELSRVPALWIDRDYGLLRWAPVLALTFFAAWLLWRSRREQIARVVPARREAEACAALLLAVCGAQALVAAFGVRTFYGDWFAGRDLVAALPAAAALAAWGLRHVPRALGAALAALTLLASAWLVVTSEAWGPPPSSPLEAVFPSYRDGGLYGALAAAVILGALAGLAAREWRAARRTWVARSVSR
jgi:hypothetical protein